MIDKYKKQLQDLLSKAGLEIQQLENLENNGFKPNSVYVEYQENIVARSSLKGVVISAPNNLVKIRQALLQANILIGAINYNYQNGNAMTLGFLQCYDRAELQPAKTNITNINI